MICFSLNLVFDTMTHRAHEQYSLYFQHVSVPQLEMEENKPVILIALKDFKAVLKGGVFCAKCSSVGHHASDELSL